MWARHTQRQCKDLQSPLVKFVLEKKQIAKKKKAKQKTNKTGITCKVVTPQRQDQVWSSSLAMLLMKLRTAVVVKPEK